MQIMNTDYDVLIIRYSSAHQEQQYVSALWIRTIVRLSDTLKKENIIHLQQRNFAKVTKAALRTVIWPRGEAQSLES